MSIIADTIPVVSNEVVNNFDEAKLKMVSQMMGNDVMIEFFDALQKNAWERACSLCPIGQEPVMYQETMAHLWRVSGLWTEVKDFAVRSKEVILAEAQREAGNAQTN